MLARCKRIPGVDEVVCAIPLGESELRQEAEKYCRVSAGPEGDVLRRYAIAAEAFDADIIVRVTGDCPLISPELSGEILAMVKDKGAVYASNVQPRTFPKGLDCEAFIRSLLNLADAAAQTQYDREHVTSWLTTKGLGKLANVESPWPIAPEGRLTLDTEVDYRSICAAFGHAPYEHLRAA